LRRRRFFCSSNARVHRVMVRCRCFCSSNARVHRVMVLAVRQADGHNRDAALHATATNAATAAQATRL